MIRRRIINKPIRADPKFEEALRKIKLERIRKGKDQVMRSNTRLTRAMTRSQWFPDLMKDVINQRFLDDETDKD